ncbi:3-oxoacyl-ACP reductase FabG [Ottowia testudinis]|uniref:3-oxoacyl-ACP reductase FabG n=1 Tax=Ottowia testudinis TaxID=2816950 RepID=A0A975H207_9BURK|nr:3-oxoacyl-ACP reductase FabG [Ottowia testudinis]QTD43696.1 3-oxoacyl-ACP reductase FabG [Ottowia testudinis]
MSHAAPARRALVTGASGAIGGAIARALATEGLHVLAHANRNRAAAEQLVAGIRAAGGAADSVVFDVTDGAACAAALAKVLESGPIQVLVHNAGVHDDGVFAGLRAEQWQRVIDVNLNGFFHVAQPLMLPMLRTRWGRIVAITSVAGQAGNRGQVNYAAAKSALHGAVKSLALECASRGVTVNAVAPGVVASEMSAGAFDAAAIQRMVPMGRAGQPREVADLVAFLASDKAAYISGQTIGINGAMYQ